MLTAVRFSSDSDDCCRWRFLELGRGGEEAAVWVFEEIWSVIGIRGWCWSGACELMFGWARF